MKEDIKEEIIIPEGFEVEIKGHELLIKGKGKETRIQINNSLSIESRDKKIIIKVEKANKKKKAILYSFVAHIKNVFKGAENPFVYKLEICSVHFPMTVSVDEIGKRVIIKNFLGEKKERVANIVGDTKVKVQQNIITVESSNKENAGQTAANIEIATKISKRDRRIFQDGIFITEKCGKKI